MALLGWLSWPVVAVLGFLCARLRLVEIGTYVGVAVIFAGLACCLWAANIPPRPFLRAFALTLFIVGVWACLGRLTFALPGIIWK
jgi:hypothetical protein